MRKIVLAADHGGFKLKEEIKTYLKDFKDLEVTDLGTNSEESVDYPNYGVKAGKAVASGQADVGIIFCGTGIGISIAANKVRGIRAANCVTPFMAEMSRKHNNANILALGGRIVDLKTAQEIVKTFLETPFEGGRHERRVLQITQSEAR